jgi:crotonobetainyl-CoA:carnitine CoA-transferase CaiB-like acyl-CoA transferase
MRHLGGEVNGISANYVWVNRGKESIVIDIKNKVDSKEFEFIVC